MRGLLVGSWALSICLCAVLAFCRNFSAGSSGQLLVSPELRTRLRTSNFTSPPPCHLGRETGSSRLGAGTGGEPELSRVNRESGGPNAYLALYYATSFATLCLCYFCLVTVHAPCPTRSQPKRSAPQVLVCYGQILSTIRRFRAAETDGVLRDSDKGLQRANSAAVSFISHCLLWAALASFI